MFGGHRTFSIDSAKKTSERHAHGEKTLAQQAKNKVFKLSKQNNKITRNSLVDNKVCVKNVLTQPIAHVKPSRQSTFDSKRSPSERRAILLSRRNKSSTTIVKETEEEKQHDTITIVLPNGTVRIVRLPPKEPTVP